MTTKEIVKELQKLGFEIQYKQRWEGLTKKEIKKRLKAQGLLKDSPQYVDEYIKLASKRYKRGIRVSSINGVKYSASIGNKVLRELTNKFLSSKQTSQLNKIRKPRVDALPKNMANALRKAQLLRRERLAKGLEDYGKITTPQIRKIWKAKGESEALAVIERYKKKVQDLVTIEFWTDAYLKRLEKDAPDLQALEGFMEVYNLSYSAKIERMDFWSAEKLVQYLYDLEKYYMSNDLENAKLVLTSMKNILDRFQ